MTRSRPGLRRWLWGPPRAHDDPISGRTVSFLELFYDLVYVAVVSQAAHHLAEHVSFRGAAEFAVVFALIWIAWVNGSLYIDVHGRDDGRTRTIVFVQMGVLVLLAVYTAEATSGSGRGFALVYATFLALLSWLWYSVHRQDRRDRPEFAMLTRLYFTGIGLSAVVVSASALLPAAPRLAVWAGLAIAWIGGMLVGGHSALIARGLPPTESLVERFGLFTIIVLGEVVFGVVGGLSASARDVTTITTGMAALAIGFGFWWIYFDLVGRRLPRPGGATLARWLLSHLPITLSITTAGAAMVSLIGHAHDARTPASTAWLLGGAVAVGLLALIVTTRALADAEALAGVYRPMNRALAMGAGAAVIAGWIRPAPWLFALVLVAILSALWIYAARLFLRAGVWADEPPVHDDAQPAARRLRHEELDRLDETERRATPMDLTDDLDAAPRLGSEPKELDRVARLGLTEGDLARFLALDPGRRALTLRLLHHATAADHAALADLADGHELARWILTLPTYRSPVSDEDSSNGTEPSS